MHNFIVGYTYQKPNWIATLTTDPPPTNSITINQFCVIASTSPNSHPISYGQPNIRGWANMNCQHM